MSFRPEKEKKIELPLTGSKLVEVSDQYLIALIFEDTLGELAQLRLEEKIALHKTNGEIVKITGTQPGLSFNRDEAK